MKRTKSIIPDRKNGRGMKRREFFKIPSLTVGLLFGSLYLPPWLTVAYSATRDIPLKLGGHVLSGIRRFTLPLPAFIIKKIVKSGIEKANKKVKQFSPLKRDIHHWVVKELPRRQTPITVQEIATQFKEKVDTVAGIVDELEAEKTFLHRHNSEGINWAYPVTLAQTPHHVTFSSGETVYAA